MISLKKTIEAYDYRSMWQAALESYVSTIQSLERHAVSLDQESLNEYRARLQAFKTRLETTDLNPVSLRELAADLDDEIKHYRVAVEALIKESASDLKDVVLVLAEATESLSQRENLHGNQLSRISGSLEAISQIDDLTQVRITLSRQVTELRTCISNMARDSETALAGLQKEIVSFQQKLEKVQIEASADPLTGLANRRRCTREITNRILAGKPFGILLFDLNKFKRINDTLGHGAGDLVLKLITQRLSVQASEEDLICRWGGDEFVIVQNGRADQLAARGREINDQLCGKFTIKLDGIEHHVSLGAEFGWAAYQEGESAEQLFARADRILYDTKAPELKLEAAPPADVLHGGLENALKQIKGDRSQWFLGCFAIRFAAKVNNHYGFPATDAVLPFFQEDLKNSGFGPAIFRGRGASLIALVRKPDGSAELEQEVRRLCSVGLEKYLKQKRRASLLPIAVGGKLIPAAQEDAMGEINAFIDHHRGAEPLAAAAGTSRLPERRASPKNP